MNYTIEQKQAVISRLLQYEFMIIKGVRNFRTTEFRRELGAAELLKRCLKNVPAKIKGKKCK